MPQHPSFVRDPRGIGDYDPATIFLEDSQNKTLRPISSGEAFTGAGFSFGQERIAQAGQYQDYSFGPDITRASELANVKAELNDFQNQQFDQSQDSNKRRSSQIQDDIQEQTKENDAAFQEFEDLRGRMAELESPNFMQEFQALRQQQGIPQLQQDLLDKRGARRELPFRQRAAMGNAGVATEGQLQAQTAVNAVPLEIQEANLIDRLKLAGDFVSNALRLKELDFNAAKSALGDAINLVGQSINLGRSRVSDLRSEQEGQQKTTTDAAQFAFQNQITQPYYEIGGTVFRTADGNPIDLPTFQRETGQQVGLPPEQTQFSNVQSIQPSATLKPSDISTFTDASGVVTAVDKRTGQTLWTARVGRSGSASPNLSVQPIADPVTGNAKYTQITDKDTGTIKYVDNATGKEVPASEVQIDDAVDPIDQLIDEITGEVLNEISP